MTDLLTRTEIVVRPNDMDADRNVNNAVYFEYFHQARLEHLHRLGVYPSLRRDLSGGNLFALVENTARYLAPAYFGDRLLVCTATSLVGRSSFTLLYQITRPSDQVEIVRGRSVQVWLAPAGGSAPIPEDVRGALLKSITDALPEPAAPVRAEGS